MTETPAAQSSGGAACQIPYPDRFHAAAAFVSNTPESAFSDEARLLFYALHSQATKGPCKDGKPWGWNVVESAKWQSWNQLGSMPQMEAMRLYVRTLDEEQPEWWTRMPEQPQPGSPGAAGVSGEPGVSISSVFQEGTWVVIQQDDAKKPIPRYEQGAALLGSQLYVLGGHYGGRYLQDLWVYNLNRLQWTAPAATVEQPQDAAEGGEEEGAALLAPAGPPASAGWSVTPFQDKLLVLGGHMKVGKLKKGESLPPISVWLVDLATLRWSALPTSGTVPCARGGHTACLMPSGDKVVVYGGEDSHRRPLGDVHVLDLQDLSWSQLKISSKAQPNARSGHVATLANDTMLVFGGGSIASCFNDLWQLDLARGAWSKPELHGPSPTPRAGHSGSLVGDYWYILGGGNNVKGCTDMLVADLTELAAGAVSWKKVCSVPPGSPLSSEGISLLHTPELNLLVAFGGYNGKYHNAVSVYKLPGYQQHVRSPLKQQQQRAAAASPRPQQQPQQDQQQLQQQMAEQQEQQQQVSQQQQQQLEAQEAAAAAASNGNEPLQNGGAAMSKGQEKNLLRDLALSREQLKRDLAAARQELELVAGSADAAKEEAAVQINMLSRQLTGAQAQAAAAEKAAEESRQLLSAEQAKTLKLEAQLAELHERLGGLGELERELARYRKLEKDSAAAAAQKGSGGLWGYISGQ
ncbi:hypothetical protein OEZ86_003944 [Tetradesmus obliquus]|nr:hypothetical protein OEZ86_003944 [Tetradesmus obliquus]